MSGICGILRLDGAPPEGITAMTKHLERRGPEGTQHFHDGPCALGHTLLATTPEALHETLPLTHAETGCTITADIRLDNREDLMPALGLANTDRIIGDGEIVLHAYLNWGEECPKHLLGDFAFAIWDPRVQKIFAARDHMGMKQLIHSHVEGKVWAFASEPQAVLKADGIPRKINEGRIADFLENYLEGIDYTSTFFEDVYRLPPAHCLTLDAHGLNLRRYWKLEPGPELKLDSDEAYAQAFLEVFTEAVRCRLRCNGPVGSMLSGGMDSGSVVAVAAKLLAKWGTGPLHTFSCLGPDPDTCIETRTAWGTINHVPGLEPHVADYTQLQPCVDDLIQLAKESDEPFDGHMNLVRAVYAKAHDSRIKVVLDGAAGDVLLSYSGKIVWLIRRGHIWRAWREAKAETRFWNVGIEPKRFFLNKLRQSITPNWARHLRRKLASRRPVRHGPLIKASFAEHINLRTRIAKMESPLFGGNDAFLRKRAYAVCDATMTTGRERFDRVAASIGVEPRDPFMDRRVVRFCSSLPPDQLEADGWPKILLRRATADLLPDAVRWRIGKEHLGWRYTQALFDKMPDWQAELSDHQERFDRYVTLDLAVADHEVDTVPDAEELKHLWALKIWIEQTDCDNKLTNMSSKKDL